MSESRNGSPTPEQPKKWNNKRAVAIAALSLASLASCTQKEAKAPALETASTEVARPSLETTTTLAPIETTTTISPEQLTRSGIEKLDAQKSEILAKFTPIEPEKMAKLVAIAQRGGALDWSDGTQYRTVKKSKDGFVYTLDAVYASAPEDAALTKPDSIQVFIRKPGEKQADDVVVDGPVGKESLYDAKLSSSLDGVIDAPLGYYTNEEYDSMDVDSKAKYPDNQQLQFADTDVEMLRRYGEQAQADYAKAVDAIVGVS
jgi:hypothetical protein